MRTDEVILAEFDDPANGGNVGLSTPDPRVTSVRGRVVVEILLDNRELLQEIKDVLVECKEELVEIKNNTA